MSRFPSALPAPTDPDPRTAPWLRWGILGPGAIAADFTAALLRHTRQEVVAVGSRSASRAAAFAEHFAIARAHGSYDDLLADDTVDAVYIATPMSEHFAQACASINAGKHVLVEKSFTRTAVEAVAVRALARDAGVFVMEAMKTLYLPHMQVLRRLLDDGVLGAVDSATATMGSTVPFDPTSRLFDRALGGGVILDIGVYPVSFVYSVFGPFLSVHASGTLAPSGVDDAVSAILTADSGSRGLVSASWRAQTAVQAQVNGRDARVEVGEPFHNAAPLELVSTDGRRLSFTDDRHPGRQGLCFQASAMARYIADGLTESPVHSLDDSVAVMRIMDELRLQVGAAFDDESQR